MDPLEFLTKVWNENVRPLIAPAQKKKKNLFGIRYDKMHEVLSTLNQVEKDRMDFFIVAATEDEPIKDYIQYINYMAEFCNVCVHNPEAGFAKGLDMQKIGHLKTSLDLLQAAIRNSDKDYLDLVRSTMPPPSMAAMRQRVRAAEIGILKQDIALGPK